MRFGTLNVVSLCRIVSLKTAASKSTKCKSYLVTVQEIRRDNGESKPTDDYVFFYRMLIIT